MRIALSDFELAVRTIATTVVDNETYFGDLDAVVGDGDFGYSMARGFEVLLAGWEGLDRNDIGTLLKQVALVISSKMGGTSGPLWGTGFLRASAVAGCRVEIDGPTVIAMLRAAGDGIQARGRAALGDKTLLDALLPATDAADEKLGAGAIGSSVLEEFAAVARQRAESTRDLQARRGRASYTGDRSKGTLDPGAVAVAVLAEALATTWRHP